MIEQQNGSNVTTTTTTRKQTPPPMTMPINPHDLYNAAVTKLTKQMHALPHIPGFTCREIIFYYVVFLCILSFLMWTVIDNFTSYIHTIDHPSSTRSTVELPKVPKVGFVVCPHWDLGGTFSRAICLQQELRVSPCTVKPVLDVFNEEAGFFHHFDTQLFQVSNGNSVMGQTFAYSGPVTPQRNKPHTVSPIASPMFSNMTSGCFVAVPSPALDTNTSTDGLKEALKATLENQEQHKIAKLSVKLRCELCVDVTVDGKQKEVCRPFPQGCPNNNPKPLLVASFSMEPWVASSDCQKIMDQNKDCGSTRGIRSTGTGDYDYSRDLLQNLLEPCRGDYRCVKKRPIGIAETTQVAPNKVSLLTLEVTEYVPPDDITTNPFPTSGAEQSIPNALQSTYRIQLRSVDYQTIVNIDQSISDVLTDQNGTDVYSAAYTMYYAPSMSKNEKDVVLYYYTVSPNTIISSISALLSLLLLMFNKLFPLVPTVAVAQPELVRATAWWYVEIWMFFCLLSQYYNYMFQADKFY